MYVFLSHVLNIAPREIKGFTPEVGETSTEKRYLMRVLLL